MDSRDTYSGSVVRIAGVRTRILKARTKADERLSDALKRAVNSESVPVGLEDSVRSIFRTGVKPDAR